MNDYTQEVLLLSEAVAYFHSRPGLARLLSAFVAKYYSLGRLGGVVTLEAIPSEEKAEMEAFFRKRLPGGRWRVSAKDFAKALAETKFGVLEPVAIMEAWLGETLDSKKQEQAREEQARHKLLSSLLREHAHPFCQLWLQAVLARDSGTKQVYMAMRRDEQFREHIELALQAMAQLPDGYLRLPVFSRQVCGNPHALDITNGAGKLFLNGLRCVRGRQNDPSAGQAETEGLSAIEEISELLYSFRILREDIMNYVTCFGLAAVGQEQELSYWQAAAQAGAPLNVPLREIVKVKQFYPADLPAEQRRYSRQSGFRVFLVENSGVFSTLLDELAVTEQQVRVPLICLQGQLKLAAWTLLDCLVKSGAILYYSGDFDPEGLQIAEKLLLRYPGRVHLWRMNRAEYFEAKPSVPLDQQRMNKLKSIQVPELACLAAAIADIGLTAYQEGLVEKLAEDLFGRGIQSLT